MGRNKVLSFMSQFTTRDSRPSNPSSPTFQNTPAPADASRREPYGQEPLTPPANQPQFGSDSRRSPGRGLEWGEGEQLSSRPVSMVQTYQPPLMEMSHDTLPELQPIFTFLNSHGNKLYQEGYFLKLDDQNARTPNADRTWSECFAQLVGTVLSLWDAAELDAAGQDGEVLPKFINLTDASIKMIEALPTRSKDDQPLQNVLSISTAGKNRYLLHFNSHHSLIQWTAGIRLAMYEHTTLQEAYTGALIAGKGKNLNNINIIMAKSKLPTEDWVRVRFGAGTPWRRCWCVITPPDEKEIQRLQKELGKKKSAYNNSRLPVLKGDVKFYDTKKTKKARPIASLSEAYSAFAIYPQSKPLIDASTLIKVEGTITIHSEPPTSTEGFVFVMPEVHPAVSGFEMMLRWLFPVFDTFALYGRPGRLIADTLDPRSLMFAMPKERRYGYLEILDVTGLILTTGSQNWRELEWRRKMKELTGRRMTAIANGSRSSRYSSRKNTRNSYGGGPSQSRTDLHDSASVRSQNSLSWGPAPPGDASFGGVPRTDSAPPTSAGPQPGRKGLLLTRQRSASESQGLNRYADVDSSKFDGGSENRPSLPLHGNIYNPRNERTSLRYDRESANTPERLSFEDDAASRSIPVRELQDQQAPTAVQPVAAPPAFVHAPGTLPASKLYHSTEMRMAKSRMSHSTLSHMTTGSMDVPPPVFNPAGERPRLSNEQRGDSQGRQTENAGVVSETGTRGLIANHSLLDEDVTATGVNRLSLNHPLPAPPGSSGSDQHSHRHTSSTESAEEYRPRLESRQSINRKPLPPRTSSEDGRDSISHQEVQSSADLDARVIDRGSNANLQREVQTNQSKDIRGSFERQRPGVLRTVGSDSNSTPTNSTEYSSDIPVVNFGPTVNYGANRLPGEPVSGSRVPPNPRNVPTPEPDQYRGGRNRSPNRTVAWQPGMAAVGANQPGRQLTPEQFVQQRAAAAIPQYGHGRQQSRSSLQSSNAMPPLVRSQSTEFLPQSRGNSNDLLQRPSSQGKLFVHGPAKSIDYSTNLSAKELQQTARASGSAPVNPKMSNWGNPPGAGLISANDAREREKRAAQQGFNNQAAQNVMNQRQQAQFGQSFSQPQAQPGSRGMGPPPGMGPGQAIGGALPMGPTQGVLPYQERFVRGNSNNPQPPQAQLPPQARRLPWGPPPLAYQQGGNWMPPQPRMPSPERQQQQLGGGGQGRGQQNHRGPGY